METHGITSFLYSKRNSSRLNKDFAVSKEKTPESGRNSMNATQGTIPCDFYEQRMLK